MANKKITDLIFNGRQLVASEEISRVVFNGKIIWPYQAGKPTIQRIVLNGEVLFKRERPYLEIEKQSVWLTQENDWYGQNNVHTNTSFNVE